MACRLFSLTRHQYGNVVLPCEDKSSEQVFYAAWVHRISTAIQRGTALMIHNIAQGNRTKSRRTKDVDVEPAAGMDGSDGSQIILVGWTRHNQQTMSGAHAEQYSIWLCSVL